MADHTDEGAKALAAIAEKTDKKDDEKGHGHDHKAELAGYYKIFFALMGLTVLTVVAGLLPDWGVHVPESITLIVAMGASFVSRSPWYVWTGMTGGFFRGGLLHVHPVVVSKNLSAKPMPFFLFFSLEKKHWHYLLTYYCNDFVDSAVR